MFEYMYQLVCFIAKIFLSELSIRSGCLFIHDFGI